MVAGEEEGGGYMGYTAGQTLTMRSAREVNPAALPRWRVCKSPARRTSPPPGPPAHPARPLRPPPPQAGIDTWASCRRDGHARAGASRPAWPPAPGGPAPAPPAARCPADTDPRPTPGTGVKGRGQRVRGRGVRVEGWLRGRCGGVWGRGVGVTGRGAWGLVELRIR